MKVRKKHVATGLDLGLVAFWVALGLIVWFTRP